MPGLSTPDGECSTFSCLSLPRRAGQTLQAGDLIAQLDSHEIQARLDEALAMREQATRELERARELFAKKITTQGRVRRRPGARASRRRIGKGNRNDAWLHESRRSVRRGRHAQAGDVGDLATPGKPIAEMEDSSALRFEADVPERLIGALKLGAELPVRVGALRGGKLKG